MFLCGRRVAPLYCCFHQPGLTSKVGDHHHDNILPVYTIYRPDDLGFVGSADVRRAPGYVKLHSIPLRLVRRVNWGWRRKESKLRGREEGKGLTANKEQYFTND